MICPNCGAEIEVFKNGYGICSFCASKIQISNNNSITNRVVLPLGTIEIKKDEFKNNKSIVSVVIPDTVQFIGESAFENCENLKEVNIPNSVKRIDNYAFKNTGIEELTIPNSIEFLGKEVFMDCINLSELLIEPGFGYSLNQTFKKCKNLVSVHCNLYDFYPSLLRGTETRNKRDCRSTFFDAFQGTGFYFRLYDAFQHSYNSGKCFLCGGEIKKSIFSFPICEKCGCDYSLNRK